MVGGLDPGVGLWPKDTAASGIYMITDLSGRYHGGEEEMGVRSVIMVIHQSVNQIVGNIKKKRKYSGKKMEITVCYE